MALTERGLMFQQSQMTQTQGEGVRTRKAVPIEEPAMPAIPQE
jgi:hypothetical protein